MASISDLEREKAAKAASAPTGAESIEDGGDDPSMLNDLLEGAGLLSQCAKLLDFIGDVELCKRITKKERAVMVEQALRVRKFLDAVEGIYEQEEFE